MKTKSFRSVGNIIRFKIKPKSISKTIQKPRYKRFIDAMEKYIASDIEMFPRNVVYPHLQYD